ncbi:universal stress protein [Streptomyces narbonensis]|uniref:Universal stress protein n=1 Tax=Streptomyces narbonensis TaxID=67333 RepID=A0ABV3C542_9ACTN
MESRLVVGVDGSDASLAALDWAVDEAARRTLPLHIVHASTWERYEGVVPARTTDRPSEQILAENVVGTAAERARLRAPDLHLTTDVLAEDASTALLREGGEGTIVVVGSRGHGEFADLLLGSVSLIVAARSHCPVVVVRGDRHALEARHGRILLGVGEHDVDSPAVRFAFREAAVREAELDVVRTWRRPARGPADHLLTRRAGGAYLAEESSELLDMALEAAASEHPRVRLHRDTVEGAAHRVLTERSAAADLLVVGARRRQELVGLELGRVAHRALHHASCPVAVVPRQDPETKEGDR